jgi:tetratricopeptide (TPR) repeat protein
MNHDAADLSSVFNINLIDVPLNLTITEHDTQLENTGNSLEEKFLDLFHIRYTYEALPYQKYAIEDSIITWFDEEFQKKDTNYFHLITQTRQITNDVKIFDTLDFLCNYIKQVIDEKVFLVVSGPVDETLWSFACNSPQIASIYIFCTLKTFGEKSNIQHSKLKGVYTEFDSLYDQLKYDVKQYENNLIQFRTLNSSITNLFDPRNQYQSLLSYYFFKYLKNILNNLDKNTHDYSEMIAFYRERYAKNYSALYKIDEFQHEYEPNYAISWYIKCSFLYRIINHALRTQNMCVLYKFRYFIKDLHDQFQLQLTQSINHWKGTVYRGECLSMENLEEYSVGCNVMYNSYLPASFCKKVALAFTSSVPNKSDFKSVLFRIDIDTDSPSSYCFACIADTNRMKDEEEVLFSIGTIFRINSIIDETDSGGPYIIDLTLDTDEKLPKLATVMQYYSKELYGWSQIGQLLLQMGNYTRAQQFFQVLLERGNRDEDQAACADILHQLGYTFHRNNDFDRALRFYKQAVQLSQESIEHMRALVATYYNIGSIYRQQKNYELSIEFFEKVHATIMKLSQFAQQSGASCQVRKLSNNCQL